MDLDAATRLIRASPDFPLLRRFCIPAPAHSVPYVVVLKKTTPTRQRSLSKPRLTPLSRPKCKCEST